MNNSPFPAGSLLAAYLRDSGGDDQDLSIPQQELEIQRWCASNNYILSVIFRDAASPGSTTAGRDAFNEMMAYFRSPDVQETGILVWKYSRFARDIDDAQFYRADLRRRGFEFYSLNDSIPPGPDGRFFEAAIDWMNQRFLIDLSTDVKRGLKHIVEQYGAVPGTPPRCFKREPIHVGKRRDGSEHILHRWVPDPVRIHLARRAFEMRAAGATYGQIQKATGLYKNKNCWPTFFSNKIYIGILEFGDLVIEDYCEPTVSMETFNQVQARRRQITNPPKPYTWLLSGLLKCAKCGSAMNGQVVKNRRGKRWEYYACNRRLRRKDCDALYIPKAPIDETVLEMIRNQILGRDNLAAVQEELRLQQIEKDLTYQRAIEELNQDLARIRTGLANVTAAIVEAGHSQALLAKLQQLEKEEIEIQSRLRQQQERPALLEIDVDELSARLQQALDEATTEELRSLLRSLVAKIVAEKEGKTIRGTIYYYTPGNDQSYAQSECPQGEMNYRHKEFAFAI